MYNPVSRSYGEPHKRPEVQNATIEFIAPSEYMVGLQNLIEAGFQHIGIVLGFNCHIWSFRAVIKMSVFSLISTAEASTACCLPFHSRRIP